MSDLSRRRFLTITGGATAAGALGFSTWAALIREQVETVGGPTSTTTSTTTTSTTTTMAPSTTTRPPTIVRPTAPVLVVIQMAGGNDGLNSLVPVDGRYNDARPTIAFDPEELTALTGVTDFGLHPALAPLARLWEDDRLLAATGLGVPDQGRSHFTASDAWMSGGPDRTTTGWIGRWLDATSDGSENPLRAIALGGGASILTAETSISTFIRSPAGFGLATPRGMDGDDIVEAFLACASPLSDQPAHAAAQAAIPATLEAVELLAAASDEPVGEDDAVGSAGGHEGFASMLDTAAGIIDMDLGTEVIVVSVHGFDTHSDQLSRQEALLTDLGAGLASFCERLDRDGNGDRVLVATTSEFGRRVAENGSGGTDHGTAACQFLIGAGSGLIGGIDLDHLVDGDVPVSIDTRSMYATCLDWLGGPTDEVLGGSYERLV